MDSSRREHQDAAVADSTRSVQDMDTEKNARRQQRQPCGTARSPPGDGICMDDDDDSILLDDLGLFSTPPPRTVVAGNGTLPGSSGFPQTGTRSADTNLAGQLGDSIAPPGAVLAAMGPVGFRQNSQTPAQPGQKRARKTQTPKTRTRSSSERADALSLEEREQAVLGDEHQEHAGENDEAADRKPRAKKRRTTHRIPSVPTRYASALEAIAASQQKQRVQDTATAHERVDQKPAATAPSSSSSSPPASLSPPEQPEAANTAVGGDSGTTQQQRPPSPTTIAKKKGRAWRGGGGTDAWRFTHKRRKRDKYEHQSTPPDPQPRKTQTKPRNRDKHAPRRKPIFKRDGDGRDGDGRDGDKEAATATPEDASTATAGGKNHAWTHHHRQKPPPPRVPWTGATVRGVDMGLAFLGEVVLTLDAAGKFHVEEQRVTDIAVSARSAGTNANSVPARVLSHCLVDHLLRDSGIFSFWSGFVSDSLFFLLACHCVCVRRGSMEVVCWQRIGKKNKKNKKRFCC